MQHPGHSDRYWGLLFVRSFLDRTASFHIAPASISTGPCLSRVTVTVARPPGLFFFGSLVNSGKTSGTCRMAMTLKIQQPLEVIEIPQPCGTDSFIAVFVFDKLTDRKSKKIKSEGCHNRQSTFINRWKTKHQSNSISLALRHLP